MCPHEELFFIAATGYVVCRTCDATWNPGRIEEEDRPRVELQFECNGVVREIAHSGPKWCYRYYVHGPIEATTIKFSAWCASNIAPLRDGNYQLVPLRTKGAVRLIADPAPTKGAPQ